MMTTFTESESQSQSESESSRWGFEEMNRNIALIGIGISLISGFYSQPIIYLFIFIATTKFIYIQYYTVYTIVYVIHSSTLHF